MSIVEILVYIAVAIGLIFNLLGSVSLFRFPDVYTRMHGATKCTTFGSIFCILAVALYSGLKYTQTADARFIVLGLHGLVALAALLLTNPTGSHAIARAAHRSGIMPKLAVIDVLAEDERGAKSE